jgi:hypothetical protein
MAVACLHAAGRTRGRWVRATRCRSCASWRAAACQLSAQLPAASLPNCWRALGRAPSAPTRASLGARRRPTRYLCRALQRCIIKSTPAGIHQGAQNTTINRNPPKFTDTVPYMIYDASFGNNKVRDGSSDDGDIPTMPCMTMDVTLLAHSHSTLTLCI